MLARALATVGGLTILPAAGEAAPAAGLPAPRRAGGMSLAAALARRRSTRRFVRAPLTLAGLSQLLWAAQGLNDDAGRRTAPSAGALYPLELLVVAGRVEGLSAGVHRYLPAVHALRHEGSALTPSTLQPLALGQSAVGDAAAVVVIAGVEARTAAKYGARAARYLAFEAGAAAQNLALQAAALGLGGVVVGGFDDGALGRVLGLASGERPVVLMPIGVAS